MRIMLYIFIILVGAWLGFKDKIPEGVMSKLSKLQYISLLFLLFIMGVNIGINRDVVNAFYKLGYQAIILAVLSIIMSVAGVKLVASIVNKKEEVEK